MIEFIVSLVSREYCLYLIISDKTDMSSKLGTSEQTEIKNTIPYHVVCLQRPSLHKKYFREINIKYRYS